MPDESAQTPVYRYINPTKANWPKADFIVGNPPYLGVRTIKTALGNSYVDTLRSTYDDIEDTCDYVMYWWDKAPKPLAAEKPNGSA